MREWRSQTPLCTNLSQVILEQNEIFTLLQSVCPVISRILLPTQFQTWIEEGILWLILAICSSIMFSNYPPNSDAKNIIRECVELPYCIIMNMIRTEQTWPSITKNNLLCQPEIQEYFSQQNNVDMLMSESKFNAVSILIFSVKRCVSV